MDVEVVGGGCWWESGGEESAYEVVAEGCRERERESNQAEEGPSGLCLLLTPEARARLLHSH